VVTVARHEKTYWVSKTDRAHMCVRFSTIQAFTITECLGVSLELNVCFYAYHGFALTSLRLNEGCEQLSEQTIQACKAMQSFRQHLLTGGLGRRCCCCRITAKRRIRTIIMRSPD